MQAALTKFKRSEEKPILYLEMIHDGYKGLFKRINVLRVSTSHNDCLKNQESKKKNEWLEHFTNCLYSLSHPTGPWKNNRTALPFLLISCHRRCDCFSGGLHCHSPMAARSED